MTKSHLQKMKLLYLMEMLRQDSDENHPLTTREPCERLAEKGISCDRRTLAKDIQVLNEQGFEVMSCACGHEKGYYVDDRTCQAELTVRNSPTFWGWLFQFGDKMRLTAPPDAVEAFLQKAEAAIQGQKRTECI